METKYNLLTRLLKNIKNVVTPDGGVAGSGGVLVVHEIARQDEVFLEGTLPNVDGYAFRIVGDKQGREYYVDVAVDLDGIDIESISISIGNRIYAGFASSVTYANGTLTVRVGSGNVGYTSESELLGLNITVYTLLTVLDKTYKEIADAGFAVLHADTGGTGVYQLMYFDFSEESDGVVVFGTSDSYHEYIAETENDYPVLVPEEGNAGDIGDIGDVEHGLNV